MKLKVQRIETAFKEKMREIEIDREKEGRIGRERERQRKSKEMKIQQWKV